MLRIYDGETTVRFSDFRIATHIKASSLPVMNEYSYTVRVHSAIDISDFH